MYLCMQGSNWNHKQTKKVEIVNWKNHINRHDYLVSRLHSTIKKKRSMKFFLTTFLWLLIKYLDFTHNTWFLLQFQFYFYIYLIGRMAKKKRWWLCLRLNRFVCWTIYLHENERIIEHVIKNPQTFFFNLPLYLCNSWYPNSSTHVFRSMGLIFGRK